jgi:hypothetical protein
MLGVKGALQHAMQRLSVTTVDIEVPEAIVVALGQTAK